MWTIFRNSLSKLWVAILGWGLGMGLMGAYLVSFYADFAGDLGTLNQMLEVFPKEFLAFFGGSAASFTNPSGFLSIEFFSYMPVVLGFFAVVACTALIAADEEDGILDLLLAHPISRFKFFLGRVLAFFVALLSINLIMWLSFAIVEPGSNMNLDVAQLAYPFLSLFAALLFFGSAALALSLWLPSRNLATTIGSVILVVSYFITSFANLDESLETVARFSPLTYYQGGEAINAMDWGNFLGLFGVSILLILLSLWRFEKKDIRIS